MEQKQNKRLEELSEQVNEMIGFGAVKEYGRKLKEDEVDLISEYCSLQGGDKKHIKDVLKNIGRPFGINDYTFNDRCFLCNSLTNYCCC